jgi:hypothetical protein
MPPRTRTRRRIVPLLLAVVLAAELGGMAIASRAAAGSPSLGVNPAAASTAAFARPDRADGRTGAVASEPAGAATVTGSAGAATRAGATTRAGAAADSIAETASAVAAAVLPRARPSLPRAAVVRPDLSASPRATTTEQRKAAAYSGRNHVWSPALGINRSVSAFPCSRTRPPDDFVYRWGCAGRNNVYLMGHAHSVLKPLHDAYVSGRLRKGMEVHYADGSGRVRTYVVIWWKTTRPTTSASWAWAAQSRPSMTIQTCVGSNSEYRLMVRLVAEG